MRSKNFFFSALLLVAAFIIYPNAAWAALPGHMTLNGERQGEIQGSCNIEGREGTILVYAFGHNINIPRDPQSGLPTGKRKKTSLIK